MNLRTLRQLVLTTALCAGLALVPLPAAGQSAAGADGAEQAARTLADDLVDKINGEKEIKKGQRVALLPLDPDDFRAALDRRGQQQLEVLLTDSLGTAIERTYDWVDLSLYKQLWRTLQDREGLEKRGPDKPTVFEHYRKILKDALEKTRIYIFCRPSSKRGDRFKLTCSAVTLEPMDTLVTGKPHDFFSSWLTGPMSPDRAIEFIADDIVRYMRKKGDGEFVVTEPKLDLPKYLAGRLEDEVNDTINESPDWNPSKDEAGTTRYRAEAVIHRGRVLGKLDLRIKLYLGDEERHRTTFRVPMHFTDDLRRIDERDGGAGGRSVAGGESAEDRPVTGGGCEAGVSPEQRKLAGGRTLADWALKAERRRLPNRDYLNVMLEAKAHLENHCNLKRVKEIMDAAIWGLAKQLEAEIEQAARSGPEELRDVLEELLKLEASAGEHLKLLELRARAYELLGDRRGQHDAYGEWLRVKVTPRTPEYEDRRLEVMDAQDLVAVEIEREDKENALELDGRKRSLVRRGLSSFGFSAGEGQAEFGESFRDALRSWQVSNGHDETGYLTEEQARALLAEGRAAEEREEDDAAFDRAKRADTEASYAAYISQYRDGRHASKARRLREAARVREAAEAVERALELTREQRVLVERGLASWKAGGGDVDGRFDAAFRALLRSWQASKGRPATGYLTRWQAEALMDLGREVEKHERDDSDFRRAKAANTVASYKSYLAKYPNGRHASEARRLREAAREEKERRMAETPAEVERALGLTREQRRDIQRGLASLGFDVGLVDGVFGPRTRSQILRYRQEKGFSETGYLTHELAEGLIELGRGWTPEPDPKREVEKFRDCDGCPWMVVVPSGSYMMGSPSSEEDRGDDEGPVHRVTISEPFAVGVYEVTFGEWDRCHRTGGCRHNPRDRGWGRGDRPVIYVSWHDAKEYVDWLSGETGLEYRLLSESEWEYVARAGTTGPFHFGSTISPEQANYDGRHTYGSGRKGRYRRRTVPVGSFPPNGFGVHDVHGNVTEWVEDCGSYCTARVVRGGSWNNPPELLRSAYNFSYAADSRSPSIGFRVARTLD